MPSDAKVAETPSTSIPNRNGAPPDATWKIMGLDATPELLAIFLVYFVQGILGLSRLAVSFYFKDELNMDPAELAIFSGFATLPWLIKPIYGFVSDTFPLFGYRRRSYLAACGVLGSLAWGTLCVTHPPAVATSLLLLAGSVGTACSDVVVDSIVVEASRNKSAAVAGSYQSLSWGAAAVGGITSAYFSGSLIAQYGVSFVFGLTAFFPLLTLGSALLISEKRVPRLEGRKDSGSSFEVQLQQVKTLWAAIKQPTILYPAVFVFLWQATPSADSALFYFYNDALGFGPEFLGRVRLAGSIASLVGIWLYNSYFKYVPLRTMFKWSAIAGTALSLTQLLLVTGANTQLGISNEWFTLSDEIVLTVLGRVSFMPVLVLAARICPEGVEATLFATLMSILNGGSVAGSFSGSLLTKALGVTSEDFSQLPLLVTICALGTLLPLPLLRLVPKLDDSEHAAAKQSKDGQP